MWTGRVLGIGRCEIENDDEDEDDWGHPTLGDWRNTQWKSYYADHLQSYRSLEFA
jgi:hypothetical protein